MRAWRPASCWEDKGPDAGKIRRRGKTGAGICGNTFFLRGHMAALPKELEEAVKIDGGGHMTTFFRVMDGAGLGPLPPAEIRIQLCRPGAAAVEGSSAKLWYRVDGDYVFAVCSEKHEIPQEFGQLDIYLK